MTSSLTVSKSDGFFSQFYKILLNVILCILNLILIPTNFKFNHVHYHKVNGSPMGNLLTPSLAEAKESLREFMTDITLSISTLYCIRR